MPFEFPTLGLSEDNRETVAQLQFLIHERFHSELVKLSFPPYSHRVNAIIPSVEQMKILNEPPRPKPPKVPIHLMIRLRTYARELLDVEIAHYPKQGAPMEWIRELVKRTEAIVMQRVREIGNLTYHATYEEMQEAIHQELTRALGISQSPATQVTARVTEVIAPTHFPVKLRPQRGYRLQIRAWMKDHDISSVKVAANRLAVSESVLKSIMTTKGKIRHSYETLQKVLKAIGVVTGDQSGDQP